MLRQSLRKADLVGSHFVCICLASTGGLAAKHPVTEEEHLPGE